MLTKQFDYNLPAELISQQPIKPRDHARLLVLNRKNKAIAHRHFYDIIDYIEKGDVIVLNDSKVIPARLLGKKETGGAIEIFLLHQENSGAWETLIKGKINPGQKVFFKRGIIARIQEKKESNAGDHVTWVVNFNCTNKKLFSIGSTPIPPYIKERSRDSDYQTVFAKPHGSVAAPTAGLHFTKPLLQKLKKKGVVIEHITLHVGLGTFAPVKVKKIEDHHIHSEFAVVSKSTAQKINRAKKNGHKIIACGTTAVRTLEAFSQDSKLVPGTKWVNIFIYPGYSFKLVDAIITNFHLPQSTLLMLISAFANRPLIKKAYQEAIREHYKFYSFGDAMFIE